MSEWAPAAPGTAWKVVVEHAGLRRVAQEREEGFRETTFPCRIILYRRGVARTRVDALAVAVSSAQASFRECAESHVRIEIQGYLHIPAFSETRPPLAYGKVNDNG
jgi:hypothetical protein